MDEKMTNYLREIQDKINNYLEFAENDFIELDITKYEICKAGLSDVSNDLYYVIEQDQTH